VNTVKKLIIATALAAAPFGATFADSTKLNAIKNFSVVSQSLASAGLPEKAQFQSLQNAGYQHVISLLPGMQLKEQKLVESLGLSFAQVKVDWMNPTQENFDQFVALMQQYPNDKVFVHCQLNWRASAFVYLYRVTQLNDDKASAETVMRGIWQPESHPQWQDFIDATLKRFGK